MAEKRLTANILLRYDSYSRWMNSDVILKQGEAAVATFPDTDPSNPPRAFGIKIGDGHRYFDELPWLQAIAADVYEWAKNPNKPVYTAIEIDGLAEYIATHTSGGSGSSSTSSGIYQIIYDNVALKYILQLWNEDTQTWDNTASEINLSDIFNRLSTIERWANGARTRLGNIEVALPEYIYDEVYNYVSNLDYNDSAVTHEFVTAVTQTDGLITVSRSPINASDITSGILSTARGGTGLNAVDEDEVLVGSIEGNIIKKKFVTEITNIRNVFATVGAIKDYVDEKTAGVTGAMHFIGESSITINNQNNRVDPQIAGYNFRNAQPGDVILANNYQEYVWTGESWRLLGDEGSYAIKGSIKNVDIADDANIAQSKINGLVNILNTKVDKVEGKQLSTNDYTDEEKEKLRTIEDNAQVNLIEHIILNGTEVIPNALKNIELQIPVLTAAQLEKIDAAQANTIEHIFVNNVEIVPTTIDLLPKSVNISFIPYTQAEKNKLLSIETGAQVNKVETLIINETAYTPNEDKEISITIDPAALNSSVLTGAKYLSNGQYEEITIDSNDKTLILSEVAATGYIHHLNQENNTYITINCGTSVINI